MLFSGEFHPFRYVNGNAPSGGDRTNKEIYRLPVRSLWLDVLQKIKALGFNCISFYVDWALLEAKPGDYRAEGVFALEPFFEAAKEAGIYLLARPGPYINAEVAGGGFPGWLQRVNSTLRSADKAFLDATNKYENAFPYMIIVLLMSLLAILPMSVLPSRKRKSLMAARSSSTSQRTNIRKPAVVRGSRIQITCNM